MGRALRFFWENFSRQTTIHGLHIVGLPKLHIFERIFWLGMVTMAAAGAIQIAFSNWTKYQTNPTVVSLLKDFRNWENPFPAVTGCFMNKVKEEKAVQYIFDKWGVRDTDDLFDKYLSFVQTVANISYSNLEDFEAYRSDDSFNNVDLLDLVIKVHPPITGTLVTFDPKRISEWTLIMTELGLCFSINSKFAYILSVGGNTSSEKLNGDGTILRCHYLNGLCYARYDSDPLLPLKYYIHSYLDIIHVTIDPPLEIYESEELEINYRMQETESSKALRDLTPSQRRCRFFDEPVGDEVPVYSTSMCYMVCRYKLAMKLCGCRPFFYHILSGKVCDLNGMVCLSKHAENLTKSPSQIGCQCPQPCNLITYFPQIPKFTKWEFGYFDSRITFRWGLLPPTTKFYRDVLFGFEDLVVSFGGTLALFLGISFISTIEVVFLIAENIVIYYKKAKHENIIKVQRHDDRTKYRYRRRLDRIVEREQKYVTSFRAAIERY